jgi:23S rRNA pseudouridine955/2504/2580 synthase
VKTIVINKNDCDQRLDKFLFKTFKNIPKNLVYKSIRRKNIKLDGKACKPFTKLLLGQTLDIYLKDEFLFCRNKFNFLDSCDRIDIVFEDKNIILVNKESGVLCHPDKNTTNNSLIDKISSYLYKKKEYDFLKENSFSPALVNRLDRNTSGLVMAAKNAQTLRVLCEKIKNKEVKKFYICVVEGYLNCEKGRLVGFILKNENKNKSEILQKSSENSKFALLKYKVLDRKYNKTLVEVELETGRSHQIRAQFSNIKHPICLDYKYGAKKSAKCQYGFALCSYKIKFLFKNPSCVDYLNFKEFKVESESFVQKFFKN